jgi:hypothetical protein
VEPADDDQEEIVDQVELDDGHDGALDLMA